MKKLLCLLLSFVILLSLSACGSPKKSDEGSVPSSVDGIVIKQPTDNSVNGYRVSISQNESVPNFTDTQSKPQVSNEPSGMLYYANTNSKKFHLADCTWAKKIGNNNLFISESRDEMTEKGYEPCQKCAP